MALIDFHSHILPGLDDGSSCVDESLAMLRMEADQGIRHIVATPHFYPHHDSPERFLQKRDRAVSKLYESISATESFPHIIMGAEVYFFRGMSQSEQLEQLTIGKKSCILIEMPMSVWTEEMYRELSEIHQRGIIPIIAHVDRYLRPFAGREILRRLAQMPVMIQANADFFLKRSTAGTAMRLLKDDRIHLLGSDCHNMENRRPNLDAALQTIQGKLGENAIRRIEMYQNELLDM